MPCARAQDLDALIETIPTCLTPAADGAPPSSRYAPILAGEHLMAKHEAATRGETMNIYANSAPTSN